MLTSRYEVEEDVGNVEVCANVTAGEIEVGNWARFYYRTYTGTAYGKLFILVYDTYFQMPDNELCQMINHFNNFFCTLDQYTSLPLGLDYSRRSSYVHFYTGDERKCFSITIKDDKTVENTEYFTVRLSSYTGVAVSGDSIVTIYIKDNDGELS